MRSNTLLIFSLSAAEIVLQCTKIPQINLILQHCERSELLWPANQRYYSFYIHLNFRAKNGKKSYFGTQNKRSETFSWNKRKLAKTRKITKIVQNTENRKTKKLRKTRFHQKQKKTCLTCNVVKWDFLSDFSHTVKNVLFFTTKQLVIALFFQSNKKKKHLWKLFYFWKSTRHQYSTRFRTLTAPKLVKLFRIVQFHKIIFQQKIEIYNSVRLNFHAKKFWFWP